MSQTNKIIAICIIAIVALLFWFNRYSYSEIKLGDDIFPLRTSRITGESEMNVMGNWTKWDSSAQSSNLENSNKASVLNLNEINSPALSALPADELNEIKGNASTSQYFSTDGLNHYKFQCNIYNGTAYHLADITVLIRADANNSQLALSRNYKLTIEGDGSVASLANGSFEVEIDPEILKRKWSWGIIGASGFK